MSWKHGLAIREAWRELLDRNGPWDWFVTLTFPESVLPTKARRRWFDWLDRLRDAVRVENGSREIVTWALVIEWTSAGQPHHHALIRARRLPQLDRERWRERWKMISGGFGAIHPATETAAKYLTKHIAVGVEPEIGGDFVGWQCRRSSLDPRT